MDLVTKTENKLKEQKAKRKEEVVLCAIEVFKKNGIDNTKISDIAKKAKIGEASMYRYFNNKIELVIEAATIFWKEEINKLYMKYKKNGFENLTGSQQVRKILDNFVVFYEEHPECIKFIYEFDNFVIRENIHQDKLVDYEKSIVNFRVGIINAIEKGKIDGTVSKVIQEDVFYNTITHTLMSLCQKLVLRGHLLKIDDDVDGKVQLKLVIDMAIKYIEYN